VRCKPEVKKMLKYCLKTTYFRGRGPQRIRKVILWVTTVNAQGTPIDDYLTTVGFRDGQAISGIAVPSLTELDQSPGQSIMGRIRDFTVRTIECTEGTFGNRMHSDIPCPGLVNLSYSMLDFFAIADNVLGGKNRVQIKCYHVPAPNGAIGGITESGNITAGNLPANILIPFEIEYTSHSGAEA
jgi:hypothetical protein